MALRSVIAIAVAALLFPRLSLLLPLAPVAADPFAPPPRPKGTCMLRAASSAAFAPATRRGVPATGRSFGSTAMIPRPAHSGNAPTSPPGASVNDPPSNPKETLTLSDRILPTLDPCVVLMKQLVSKHSGRWEGRGGIFSLAQGVVYWKPPRSAYESLAGALESDEALHTYCPDEGLPELVSALKEKLAEENGLNGGVEVMVTTGANQAYMNCVLTLMGEGEKCVVFRPYYFNHVMAVQMTRGEESLLVGPCSDGGVPDLRWLRDQFDDSGGGGRGGGGIKMVTLVNPGNPTGTSLPRAVLDDAIELCRENGAWLVVDNTYEHFDHSGANSPTLSGVPFWCSSEEHVINVFSFSKAFALAGFRVGYAAINAGPHSERGREAYNQMIKVQDTVPICPPRPSQIAALGSLSAGRSWVAEKVSTLDASRDAILDALSPLAEHTGSPVMGGSGAMYVMAKLPDGLDDRAVAEDLVEKHGIAIIPGSFCGLPGWVRVCYSNLDPEKCKEAAARLKGGVEKICRENR